MTESNYDENWAKKRLKKLLDDAGAFHFPVPASGMGVSGVSDRLALKLGVLIAIEAKRPGRRGQKHRGASELQVKFLNSVTKHHGVAFVFDGEDDDVELLNRILSDPSDYQGYNNLNADYWKK